MLIIFILGGYIGVATLWIFHHYLSMGGEQSITIAYTVVFTSIIILEKMNVFNFRSLRAPISVIGLFSNPWVIGAWLLTVGLQIETVYVPVLQQALHTVPLVWSDWGLIFLIAAPVFLVTEIYKIIRWQQYKSITLTTETSKK